MKVSKLAPGPKRAWQEYQDWIGQQTLAAPMAAKALVSTPPSKTDEVTASDVKSAGEDLQRFLFWLGPTYQNDLRRLRPYFLVPLGDAALPGESDLVLENMRGYIRAAKGQKITDLYVLSHGWHRNLLSGVAAYDRLVSRFALLGARGRLSETPDVAPPADFCPLFVALHWHSDPGDDRWVDKSGRRHKDSFVENCRAVFAIPATGSDAQFLSDFENLFEFMSKISVADVDTLGQDLDAEAARLTATLTPYLIRSAPPSTVTPFADKVAALWRCYFESENKALLADQTKKARPVGDLLDAFSAFIKFVIGAAGIGIVTNLIPLAGIKTAIANAWNGLADLAHADDLWKRVLLGIGVYAVATVLLIVLFLSYGKAAVAVRGRKLTGTPLLGLLLWLPLQVLTALPVLTYLLTSFTFRTVWVLAALIPGIVSHDRYAWLWSLAAFGGFGLVSTLLSATGVQVPGLYDERPTGKSGKGSTRSLLAGLARTPIRWLRDFLAPDSNIMQLGETLDSQFAFFEMQEKGANVGEEAGNFLTNLTAMLQAEGQPELKIHLVGHSFGGLVVCNAARTYLQRKDAKIQSLCLVEAAIASNWFEKEQGTPTIPGIDGALTCIYSGYDTANGFYYPAANNGRLAAGYVGLCKVPGAPNPPVAGQKGAFAMLVRPPDIEKMAPPATPYVVNLDASRIVYQGGVALGGGHDDIFKDDVVNLIWSATRIEP